MTKQKGKTLQTQKTTPLVIQNPLKGHPPAEDVGLGLFSTRDPSVSGGDLEQGGDKRKVCGFVNFI